MRELKEEIDKSIIRIELFNTPLSVLKSQIGGKSLKILET